ncbi:MAG TPA: hypothetical protein DEB64_07185 [Alistipes sp.]|uniref:DUF5689 domain-containing protein n=1 Tax=Alistipes sp. UBA6068 TaxID=1946012 RepID=UPI000E9A5C47|nr:DUF5689 domain-containing protein [Alistipes sp. UBA6068]HBV50559.1 hypothetical protein [Alistipes sp.]
MKNFNFWRSLFFAALAVVGFAACSDDDDNGGNSNGEASLTVNGKQSTTIGVKAAAGDTEAVEVVSSNPWTLAFETEQDWCVPSVTAAKGGTSSLKFTVTALPEGVEERSATAILSSNGEILGVPYTVTAKVTVRQSPSGSATPDTNVAAVRALLVAMNPTSTKTDVTAEIGAMTLTGIVVSNSEGKNTGSDWNIAIQDGVAVKNSGLTISCSKFQSASYAPGTCVTVALTGAQVQLYNGLLQLNIADAAAEAVKTVSTDAPEPVVIAPDALFDYESMLVQVDNCYPTAGYGAGWNTSTNKGNVNFATADGQAFVCRTGSKAVFKDQTVPEKMGSLVGIAGRYNNDKQISPRTIDDIKLTEAIPEPEYTETTIAGLTAGNREIKDATIVGVHQQAVMLAQNNDGTVNYVLAFNKAWKTQDANPFISDVDKTASIKGIAAQRYGLWQFSDFTITPGAASSLVLPEPANFDAAAIATYTSEIAADENKAAYKYIKMTGTLTIEVGASYNTYRLLVPGCPTEIQFAYGLNSYFAGRASGDVVDVTGFALGYDSSNNRMNVLLRSIKENTSAPSLLFTTEPKAFAGSTPEVQTLNFVAKNIPSDQLIDFTFDGDNRDKFNVEAQDATSVTIKAVGDNASGAPYTAKLVASWNGTTLAELAVEQEAQLPDGAKEATVVCANLGYTNQFKVTSITGFEPLAFSISKASGTTDPAFYTATGAIRFYAGTTLTISGATILKVEFTFVTPGNYNNWKTVSTGTYSGSEWTGEAPEVVFTSDPNKNSKDKYEQTRVLTIKVTYKE